MFFISRTLSILRETGCKPPRAWWFVKDGFLRWLSTDGCRPLSLTLHKIDELRFLFQGIRKSGGDAVGSVLSLFGNVKSVNKSYFWFYHCWFDILIVFFVKENRLFLPPPPLKPSLNWGLGVIQTNEWRKTSCFNNYFEVLFK